MSDFKTNFSLGTLSSTSNYNSYENIHLPSLGAHNKVELKLKGF